MKLSTKGRYALITQWHILLERLSLEVSVAEISNKLGISQTYLEQLFMKLRKPIWSKLPEERQVALVLTYILKTYVFIT